jgi:hypothetical protein
LNIKYDLRAFKVLIRKLLPPKKSVFTVDTTGDGTADSIQIKIINLLIPFVVPEKVEIGDINLENLDISNYDLSEYLSLFLDDEFIDISKNSVDLELLKEKFSLYHKGESFTLDDIIAGKLSGRTIALGDTISLLIKFDAETLTLLTEGKHSFKIESDIISNLIIPFELDETNMNLPFDPNIT